MTPKQSACLNAIRRLTKEGVSPSLEKLRVELGLASKATVHRLLVELEDGGHIRRIPRTTRQIEVLDDTLEIAKAVLAVCDLAHEQGRRVTLDELHRAISGMKR